MKTCFTALIPLIALSTGINAQAAPDPIKVGVVLRFAPEKNSFASSLYEGIELAAQEHNAKAPLKIELVKYSHKEGYDSLGDAAKRVIKDKVHLVLGGEMSDDAFTLSENFQGKDILLMTATASNPLLTAGKPYVFRVCFSDDQVATLMAKYVASLKDMKSIGVLHNTANAYSDYITNAFLDELEKVRGNKNPIAVSEFRYATEQPRFEGAVDQFKKAGVNLVVAFTLQESLKSFDALAEKSGFHPQYVGSDGWGPTESLVKNIPHFHGVRSEYWNDAGKSAQVAKFKAQFLKTYGKAPNGWNAVAYDSAIVLFDSLAMAKAPGDVAEVAGLIKTGSFSDVVTANQLKFTRNNSPKKPLYLYEIKEGKSHFLKSVE